VAIVAAVIFASPLWHAERLPSPNILVHPFSDHGLSNGVNHARRSIRAVLGLDACVVSISGVSGRMVVVTLVTAFPRGCNVVGWQRGQSRTLRAFVRREWRRRATRLSPVSLVTWKSCRRPDLADAVSTGVTLLQPSLVPSTVRLGRTALAIARSTDTHRRLSRTGPCRDRERRVTRVWEARASSSSLVSGNSVLDHRGFAHAARPVAQDR
jgi:hypothetical protein